MSAVNLESLMVNDPNKGSEDANKVFKTMDNGEKTYDVKGPGEPRKAWPRKREQTGKRSRNRG